MTVSLWQWPQPLLRPMTLDMFRCAPFLLMSTRIGNFGDHSSAVTKKFPTQFVLAMNFVPSESVSRTSVDSTPTSRLGDAKTVPATVKGLLEALPPSW